MTDRTRLDHLSSCYGIALEYTDIWGQSHPTSAATQRALLAAMGVPAETKADLEHALADYERRAWGSVLAPVQVVQEETEGPFRISLTVPIARVHEPLRWRLMEEGGQQHSGDLRPLDLEVLEQGEIAGTHFTRYLFPLPCRPPLGYHCFEIVGEPGAHLSLIVAPRACYQPLGISEEGWIWGLTVQLYSLRSQRNWGIGDFTDLKELIEIAAELGADIVGLNPLHTLFPHNPLHASPYSPSSRIFLNILYLDVEAIAELAECEAAQQRIRAPQFQVQLRALRAVELVDYQAVATAKLPILEMLYQHFCNHHREDARGAAFRAYQAAQGRSLRIHALFEALQEYFHGEDPSVWGWPVWPAAYRDPGSEAVAAFATVHQARIEFYQYLQWQADLQLEVAGSHSLELGLEVGIYQDLAVSIDQGGAEAWVNQPLYALNARIGAPPDEVNLKGQDWGLLPLIPYRLREAAYAPFIATLRANMRHAGALRLDHVMGLLRLFWILPGRTPEQGAYVSYPFEDLLAILALESVRNRCLVVGEDLGTVPEAVREALPPLGVLSYRLFYFEKTTDGGFKPPAEYPRQALVAISTHDLPTLSGYWQGVDLERRTALGLFPTEEIREQQVVARAQDRAWLLVALEREGLLPGGCSVQPVAMPEMSPELMRAVHLYLARTPAQVMVVQPEDIFGQVEQANLPGTIEQHPNWRRKLLLNLEDWMHEPRLQIVASALSEARGRPDKPSTAPLWRGVCPLGIRIPRATYRLQFNRDFTFHHATRLIPYLHTLGISHCYASPYLKARPGSSHGYDIIDHQSLNPEIGSLQEFDRFVDALHDHGMGQILDIVPNHMGVMGADNAWWLDVLENGPAATHARFFDIDWQPVNEALRGRVLLSVLGDRYGAVLESGELRLIFDLDSGAFSIHYYAHHFPLDPGAYPRILGYHLDQLEARLDPGNPHLLEYQSLITAFNHLPPRTVKAPEELTERNRDKAIYKQHLAELCRRSPDIAWFIDENVRAFNGRPGEPVSFELLHDLLEAQAYRLAHWRVASDEINYRRFFDINELAALRMEDKVVFDETHGLVLQLIGSGKLEGLRIDHPDGIYDPVRYFKWIQGYFSSEAGTADEPHGSSLPIYIVVEKILASYEHLPADWPVQGTTGYDFANLVNGLFVDTAARDKLDHIYTAFIGEQTDFDELLYRCKKHIVEVALASELNVLANQLSRLAQADWRTRDFTLNNLRGALAELVACFPVYRTYITGEHISAEDRRYVDWAVAVAKRRSPAVDISIFDFIREVLLIQAAEGKPEAYREAVVALAMKFQQYTAPVMAKGLEDTSFYVYHRLVSLNEVGGDPRRFGTSVALFHRANQERARHWPQAMVCTSTHDTKRSEDVRARINVLSELPEEWQASVERWHTLNRSKKGLVDDTPAPVPNDEYLLYQTLIGTWPLGEPDEAQYRVYCERIERYMLKAVREAKVRSSWINPNTAYEEALAAFVRNVLEDPEKNVFLAHFRPFQARIARVAMYNSLAQILLKFTVPGVPDIYQGNELWDFSLVDPDNRRPVDYDHRAAMLRALQELDGLSTQERVQRVRGLLDSMQNGRIKLYVTWRSLALRQAYPDLFRHGDYYALNAVGQKADHICALARHYQGLEAIVVVPRLIVRLLDKNGNEPLGAAVWQDTSVVLPVHKPRPYQNVFTGEEIYPEADGGTCCLPLAALLTHFPLALLMGVPEN